MEYLIPVMCPPPGERLLRFVGDRLRFSLRDRDGRPPTPGWRALLRTNLGRAESLRREVLQAHTRRLPLAGASWRDLVMTADAQGWTIDLPLAEIGFFQAKAYLLDPRGWQHWPHGPDVGISVHPDSYRTGNTIYCAFPRMFGPTKTALDTRADPLENAAVSLDKQGYTVIPPSGKLRDLVRELPHIIDKLGCRILHLLPVHPTPTTYARFGRFGSPYAALDIAVIDPALVEFDKRTTGLDQFRELTYAAHTRGARVIIDIVINHTGWGSVLEETHPEWFLRDEAGRFSSPGAWGTTWEDLVELRHDNVKLWDGLADMFLVWCRRGVDGFRCDAGYKVPVGAWQYIVTKVRQEYPETLFLLEGLGGAWEATESLLTEGGMQWAYSELFQNYIGLQVANYLDHTFRQSARVGLLVHYSETHDNPRLASRGRGWALLRNRLCALASVSGGFGFTCGVEWLATEKVQVHGSTGMAWGAQENIVPELTRLNGLLKEHPAFFDGAAIERLGPVESPVLALRRVSAEGKDQVLVLVNTDPAHAEKLTLGKPGAPLPLAAEALERWTDLLGQPTPRVVRTGQVLEIQMPPGSAYCLAPTSVPQGLHGEPYRRARALAAWGIQALSAVLPCELLGDLEWHWLAQAIERSPAKFLCAVSEAARKFAAANERGEKFRYGQPALADALQRAERGELYPAVVRWQTPDTRREVTVPPRHWLLVEDPSRFRASLGAGPDGRVQNVESIAAGPGQIACFAPREEPGTVALRLERYAETDRHVSGAIRFLAPAATPLPTTLAPSEIRPDDRVLLTNGRGAMARMCVDLGRITSKYDCVLGANLHPSLPVDRHIFVKRVRVWVNADGFISPLDFNSLARFAPGPPAVWDFVANAGDGRTVEVRLKAEMLPGRNATLFRFSRPTAAKAKGKQLPASADVRLTVRVDLEDRDYHGETRRNGGADHHFNTHTHPLAETSEKGRRQAPQGPTGFRFTPAPDRHLLVAASSGAYHPQPEWSENIPHPVEQTRGHVGSGDAFSPGWFDLPLVRGGRVALILTADETEPRFEVEGFQLSLQDARGEGAGFEGQLVRAAKAFLVKRGAGFSVIAGYPWFLDWGRDTFICARGLLAGGLTEEVRQILLTFARFEDRGTLPNTIFGEDASNRDTSDAPLWFGLVCEELAALTGPDLYQVKVGRGEVTLRDTLWSIANHYARGTPNGIRMDPASALVWSPSHFTWMDTNYPACTPRQGYPVEIQALWIRLLRQLATLGSAPSGSVDATALAEQALVSFERCFWREERGYFADLLVAGPGQAAAQAAVDDALRSNCLFAVTLGLVTGERARRCVAAARNHLVVPGALRSLASLPVGLPLPNLGNQGQLLNDPNRPYWGQYEGDEDTRRKPAYHNGTAWTWTFPHFCEALARAWNFAPPAAAAARAWLGSIDSLLASGCLGQLPEIVDGDAPHTPRGCDAQAWGVTEALRVWRVLQEKQIRQNSVTEA